MLQRYESVFLSWTRRVTEETEERKERKTFFMFLSVCV